MFRPADSCSSSSSSSLSCRPPEMLLSCLSSTAHHINTFLDKHLAQPISPLRSPPRHPPLYAPPSPPYYESSKGFCPVYDVEEEQRRRRWLAEEERMTEMTGVWCIDRMNRIMDALHDKNKQQLVSSYTPSPYINHNNYHSPSPPQAVYDGVVRDRGHAVYGGGGGLCDNRFMPKARACWREWV
eukprot:GHVQ01028287.1.p1 GENE.GHVQ01028287.1~~GHVQ01028287.1.p1  ORF type:complete len:184 (+),score=47.13 GHVQ01028287.1:220-771(+)